MGTKSKKRKRKTSTKVEEQLQPRVKTSTRVMAFVAIISIFALIAGMIALGSAGLY